MVGAVRKNQSPDSPVLLQKDVALRYEVPMKKLFLAGLFTFATLLFAVEPSVQKLIGEGDAVATTDKNLAERSYVGAKGAAANLRDNEGMLLLADRFLRIGSEAHAKNSFLIAFQISREKALNTKSASDQNAACLAGIAALAQVAFAWENLSTLGMVQLTRDDMQGVADQAAAHATDYLTKGCP